MQRELLILQLNALASRLRAMGVAGLYLFGSTARNEAHAGSNVDIFIDTTPNTPFSLIELAGLKDLLEDELHVPVDITTRESLHPLLKHDIEASAIHVL